MQTQIAAPAAGRLKRPIVVTKQAHAHRLHAQAAGIPQHKLATTAAAAAAAALNVPLEQPQPARIQKQVKQQQHEPVQQLPHGVQAQQMPRHVAVSCEC